MPACRYVIEAKRLAGVTLKVNLRECLTCMPLPSVNNAACSGFETQGRHHQKSKIGVSVAPQKDLCSPFLKKKQQHNVIYLHYPFVQCHMMKGQFKKSQTQIETQTEVTL